MRVMRLPDDISPEELSARESKYEEAAIFLATNLETVGLMVYRDLVDFEIVRDLLGDAVIATWKKLRRWTFEMREDQDRDTVFDWYEWLAIKLEEDYAEFGHHSVFIKRRKWKPKSRVF